MIQRKNLKFRADGVGAAISIRVVPRSSCTEIAEILNDGTVKIRLNSGSSDSEINKGLIEYLVTILQVNPDQVDIVAGLAGHDKLVSIMDLDSCSVQDRILKNLS
jgi:uncharacterized protein YggU (UPF0235/DUF167 family)